MPELIRHPVFTAASAVALAVVAASAGLRVCADENAGIADAENARRRERVRWQSSDGPAVVEGTVTAAAADGTLLVLRSDGALRLIPAARQPEREPLPGGFRPDNADELAAGLLQQTGAAFAVARTDHYLICSDSSPEYAEFCGRLLEQVHSEFFEFFDDCDSVQPPERPLPVIIFASPPQFREFARQQHPDVSFEDTPGYYSVRDNQILLIDLSGNPRDATQSQIRRHLATLPRQMATVVHEAVHQLAFNSGLQVRMADNPLWFSEGLALYFETGSSRTPLLWNRPGRVSPVHQPAFEQHVESGTLPVSVRELVGSDAVFQNPQSFHAAYTESWALTTYLIQRERAGFQQYVKAIAAREALVGLTEEQRIREFEAAFGGSADEIQEQMIRYVLRLRPTR